MARREHEPKQVVADIVVEGRLEICHGQLLPKLGLVTELLVLPLDEFVSAKTVDGAMLRRRHEPGARLLRDARRGPLLERSHESILCKIFGEADVANDSRETRDEPRRLDAPHRIDRAAGICNRHWLTALRQRSGNLSIAEERSHHLQSAHASD
jgi:hypothetical protein